MSGETPADAEIAEDATTFEAALEALEARVRALEGGDVTLDEGLSLYEEGVALARRCHGLLDAAEQRVAAVVQGSDGPELRPVDDEA